MKTAQPAVRLCQSLKMRQAHNKDTFMENVARYPDTRQRNSLTCHCQNIAHEVNMWFYVIYRRNAGLSWRNLR